MASTVLLLVQYVRERFFKGGEFRDLAHYHLEETEQRIRETYPEEADCPGSRGPADIPDLTPPASQFSSFSSCWWYTIPQPWWNTLSSPLTPLGFIDRTTDDGALIMLTSPRNSHSLHPETWWP